VQHEAPVWLLCIGVVLLLDPAWPLQLAEPGWRLVFSVGLAVYVVLRRRWSRAVRWKWRSTRALEPA